MGMLMADAQPRAIAFGEVLFDCFEDSACAGGAPLNFAWYLRQFGIEVAVLSAVGRDELGAVLQDLLRQADIVSWLCERPQPTGRVDIRVVDGQPEFDIHSNVAWDYIEFPEAVEVQPELVYFGTVAQRTAMNRASLKKLLGLEACRCLYDVNQRPNFFSTEIVLEGLERANILKLNEEEWATISRLVQEQMPSRVLERFDLDLLALTQGSEGAELYVPGKEYRAQGPRVAVVDTVGAGDAFSAALAAGLIQGADPGQILEVACEAATFTVQQRGPQVELPENLRRAFAEKCGPKAVGCA